MRRLRQKKSTPEQVAGNGLTWNAAAVAKVRMW